MIMDNEQPRVESIMREIRSGLDDISLSNTTRANLAGKQSLQAELRKLTETAPVLGRCGGSIRGKICKRLAYLALPVIEQLDLFHAATRNVLSKLANIANESTDTARKLAELEARIKKLETGQEQASGDGDSR